METDKKTGKLAKSEILLARKSALEKTQLSEVIKTFDNCVILRQIYGLITDNDTIKTNYR